MWRLLLVATLTAPSLFHMAAQQRGTEMQLDSRPRPLDCSRLEVLKNRAPLFFDGGDGVRVGISTAKGVVTEGGPVVVGIWTDNRSDKPVNSGGECPPFLFTGDVFDSSGRRLIGAQEQTKLDAQKKGGDIVEVCSMSLPLVQIPPHTCKAPGDSFSANRTLDYVLGPGVYYLVPGHGTDPRLFTRGLKITVLPK
jgi:hypothetical protein